MKEHPSPNHECQTASVSPFSAADLPVDEQGRIYHLQIKPEQLAPDILLVGDPGRAEFIGSEYLSDLEVEHEHRGYVTVTGVSQLTGEPATIISPIKTTVTTSGIGASSLEVILNELVALNEIDFQTRKRKASFPRFHVVRVGTSGALQASTTLGTPIITSYAIGLDNTGVFYEAPYPDETSERLEREMNQLLLSSMSQNSRFYGSIRVYISRAEPVLVEALLQASAQLGVASKLGLTASASGFFAPQGRDIARVKPSIANLDEIFSAFDPRVGVQRIENMEMESSFLLHFLGAQRYWAGSICPAIANRREDTFDSEYLAAIKNATSVALLALTTLRKRYGEVLINSEQV